MRPVIDLTVADLETLILRWGAARKAFEAEGTVPVLDLLSKSESQDEQGEI